jgi:flagellar biosynthesis/type III secretory pathway protein FliH
MQRWHFRPRRDSVKDGRSDGIKDGRREGIKDGSDDGWSLGVKLGSEEGRRVVRLKALMEDPVMGCRLVSSHALQKVRRMAW